MADASVEDRRAIGVKIDDVEHEMTLTEAQRLYDALGALVGIHRHGGNITITPNRWPSYPITWSSGNITTNPLSPRTITASVKH